MRRRGFAFRAALVLTALWLGTLGLQGLGQEPKKTTAGPYAGTVVDPAGKPAPGVKVRVVTGSFDQSAVVLAEAATDEKGRFQIGKTEYEFGPQIHPASLIARDSQGRIGGSGYLFRQPGQPLQDKLSIKLLEVQEYRGRLVDTSGQPIAKAVIEPIRWSEGRVGEPSNEAIEFPADLLQDIRGETDADGGFVLHGVPPRGQLAVNITAPAFGSPRTVLGLENPVTVRLDRPGNVRGKILCAKDPAAADRAKLSLRVQMSERPRWARDEFAVIYYKDDVNAKGGSFQFENVPPGSYLLGTELDEKLPYFAELPEAVQVKPGESTSVSITLKPAVAVQGKVVDKQTGAGIPGVRVSLYFQEEASRPSTSKTATTDAQGAFTVYVQPGKTTLNAYGYPEQYLPTTSLRRPPTIEITKDTTLPPIELEAARALDGVVVDESGKPVSNAEIRSYDMDNSLGLHDVIRSDAAGKFSLKKALPNKPVMIRVRTDKAAADPINVVAAECKEPVRLVVLEKKAFAVRGRLVDDAGKPLQGAAVKLMTHWWFGSSGVGFLLTSLKTDAEGRFAVGGLWPGDGYNVEVSAEGCETHASREIKGESGKSHDFGRIVLARADRTVEGIVVDSAGKALADVRVFNSGDGPEPISAKTDNTGRFRLSGFRSGPVFVFAEKEGYRFTGLRTPSGAAGVSLKMLRKDELVPQTARAAGMPEQERRQLARKLLEQRRAAGGVDAGLVSAMAKIDLEQAQKWSAEAGGKFDRNLRRALIEKTAQTDLDEAISLLSQESPGAMYLLRELADRFAASDPAKAMRCAEEAVVRARSLDQPQRAVELAQGGALVARLGNKEAGRKLIEEAADMAAKMGAGQSRSYIIGTVAATVAPYDLQRASRLIEGITEKNEQDRWRCNAAAALDDVKQAEAMLKGVQAWYAERARMRLAYRLARKNPAGAVRYVENLPKSAYTRGEENKAQAYGALAVAIAPRDKALACSLIDRAFAIYLAPSDDRFLGGRGGPPTQAALLAAHAREIGYPDMDSVIDRVLALRPTTKNSHNPAAAVESTVVMATFLALVDPETARQVLQSFESRSDVIGSGYSGVGRDEWLKAWALADPAHAVELAEREAASAKGQREKDIARSAADEMIQLWTSSRSEQIKQLARRHGIGLPDEED